MLSLLLLASLPATALRAGPLDPLAFTSLGTLQLTAGNYVIDSSVPVLKLQFGGPNVTFTGTLVSQGTPGGTPFWGFDPQVAMFDFDSISIAVGVNVYVSGPNPVALLSRGSIAINGNVDTSGNPGDSGAGVPPFGGSGLGGRGGAGGGGGGNGAFGSPAAKGEDGHGPGGENGAGAAGALGGANSRGNGAGFGGRGGDAAGGLVNASNYGDLAQFLQGGAGGGGTGTDASVSRGSGGGGGGGAIEIGAVTGIAIAGNVLARGGAGGVGGTVHGGGGSGGGILIHAPNVQLGPVAAVNASGGIPNGAGGRVRILTSAGSAVTGPIAAGHGTPDGENGVIEFGTLPGASQPLVLTISWASLTPPVLDLCWPASAGVKYQLEGSLSAASTDWHGIGPVFPGNGVMHCLNQPVALVDSLFYRVRVVP
jgi:hypothetical protein